jgi:hypothetical protein
MKMEVIFTGDPARKQAAAEPPFGPSFSAQIVEKTERLEVSGSGFDESGPDDCEFRVFDSKGELIGIKRIGGY